MREKAKIAYRYHLKSGDDIFYAGVTDNLVMCQVRWNTSSWYKMTVKQVGASVAVDDAFRWLCEEKIKKHRAIEIPRNWTAIWEKVVSETGIAWNKNKVSK